MGNACKKAGIQPGVVLSSAHTKRLWEKYDKSNTGHLSRKDARSFLKDYAAALKGQLSDSDANALLDECDPSSKGQLSYEEFKRLCAQSASKIDSNISLTSSMQLCINHTQDATPPSSSGSASSSSSSSSSSSTHTATTTTTTSSSSSGSSSSSSATKSPPAKAAPPPSGPTLFFDDYRDLSLSGERMGMDGMQKFASDLGIEADDVFLFVFAWKAKAAKICEFSREEFVRGFEAVGCKSIADLKAKVPTVRAMIDSKDGYRQYYEFFFDYSKEPHTKFMTVQEATVMLPLVLGTRFTQLDRFLVFLENVHKKPIGRDIWKELLPFAEQFKSDPDFATYDSGECWPVVFDKFVDWVQHPPAEGEGEGENATASTS